MKRYTYSYLTILWPVTNYTACQQRHTCANANNLQRVAIRVVKTAH